MRRILVVAALLVLAGCSGAPAVGDDERSATETVTPVAVPGSESVEPHPRDVNATHDTAVTPGSETPFGALLRNHSATLQNQSVTVEMSRLVRGENTTEAKNVTAYISADRRVYHADSNRTGMSAPPDRRVWSDGDTLEYRIIASGVTEERVVIYEDAGTPPTREPADIAEPPLWLLFEQATDSGVVEAQPSTAYQVPLDPTDRLATGHVENVTEPKAEVLVGPDGNAIAAYSVRFEATRQGTPVTVTYAVRFVDIGSTQVPDRPYAPDSADED